MAADDLWRIYTAPTAEAAADELERFADKWERSHPAISQIWRRNWPQIKPFFACPPDIRKVIYTTNAVESRNMTLRKVIKTRASFPIEEAAIKLLYLGLLNVATKWNTVQNWREALNHFHIMCRNECRRWSGADMLTLYAPACRGRVVMGCQRPRGRPALPLSGSPEPVSRQPPARENARP